MIRHEVADLLRRFASATPPERCRAIRGIGTVARRSPPGSAEQEATVHALVLAAQDADVRLRRGAVRGLAHVSRRTTFATVAAMIADDDYVVREAAVRAVLRLDSGRAVRALVAASHDARAPVRCAALIGLRSASIIDEDVWAALVAGLADADPSVQGAAMASLRALSRRAPELAATVDELARQGLNAESPCRREISLELLRQLGAPGHRERCRAALSDADPGVRRRAEYGLRNQ
ncbi:hypothetical protein GCM10010168_89320 [Actinoplanes ianthinogenes]|uniref:HEAT repeat protein n=1 Tax=Actinoplanes ianthinogenes TaxID=122358 RepID=A0ABM7LPX4_9ACTN|nr:HEAT repeat domain-containing protein [Actinoplanes ianthinogenes]BCJ41308.1 hypothetical protein Aiant_19650 [Actinoplanes ianthinogenes]GGR56495.1 hypothetical protein GCM10010168_89320 [Actinoplanes ianthinogenes]